MSPTERDELAKAQVDALERIGDLLERLAVAAEEANFRKTVGR